MATGLLIVCTGKGTKACDTFMAMSKSYSGTIRLGEGTATYDAEVEVSERLPWAHITDEDLQRAAASFTGEQMQVWGAVASFAGGQCRCSTTAVKVESRLD